MILLSQLNHCSGEVLIASLSRAANGGIGAAKAAGNYAGFYPTTLAG
jgi:branched-chain amino acid aminotransferase